MPLGIWGKEKARKRRGNKPTRGNITKETGGKTLFLMHEKKIKQQGKNIAGKHRRKK